FFMFVFLVKIEVAMSNAPFVQKIKKVSWVSPSSQFAPLSKKRVGDWLFCHRIIRNKREVPFLFRTPHDCYCAHSPLTKGFINALLFYSSHFGWPLIARLIISSLSVRA